MTEKLQSLTAEEAKMLLMEIFSARQYGNQELIQTLNELEQRLLEKA